MTSTTLQLPSFLHGPYLTIEQKAQQEGRRSGEQFLLNGVFSSPELRPVATDEWVFTDSIVDFTDWRPAWRLYAISHMEMSVCEADEKNHRHLFLAYEEFFRQTAWGALYFALEGHAPQSAEQTALRLKAVLGFWDSLHHGRYLYRKLNTFLTLEGLLTAACGWALEAWCPETTLSLRSRFEVASDRMARATREECIETILRHHARLLVFADRRKLNHPDVVTQLAFWRERLTTLDVQDFARISAVQPGEVLGMMHRWDRELDLR